MATDLAPPVNVSSFDALDQLVRAHRPAAGFTGEPVPREVVDNALALAAQALPAREIQPARFLVLSDPAPRRRLAQAAAVDPGFANASVVIVALAAREPGPLEPGGSARTRGRSRRETMIAFTVLQLAIEAQGWNTAPSEAFAAAAVHSVFNLPADAEVVAVLAVGRAAATEPPNHAPPAVSRIAFRERYGVPLTPFDASES